MCRCRAKAVGCHASVSDALAPLSTMGRLAAFFALAGNLKHRRVTLRKSTCKCPAAAASKLESAVEPLTFA
jgi:hypothetical protein